MGDLYVFDFLLPPFGSFTETFVDKKLTKVSLV